jgi:hypothetical protein
VTQKRWTWSDEWFSVTVYFQQSFDGNTYISLSPYDQQYAIYVSR